MKFFEIFKSQLLNLISDINNTELIIALSGGLDSVVLLSLLYNLKLLNNKLNIQAVYINHQLQPDSDRWIEFNKNICEQYNIDYKFFNINTKSRNLSKLGLEAAARAERYKVFAELVNQPNKILLTAHHLNDQAETVLLQLMRAAGPKGLSAMPEDKKFSAGRHLRPLLSFSRNNLLEYAKLNNLNWVEDKSNLDNKFDRNYIRNNVMQVLEQRWPNAIRSLALTAEHCAEQERLLNFYIKTDYDNCFIDKFKGSLDINKLKQFDKIKQKAIIRYWFDQINLLPPGAKKLKEIIDNCIYSRQDAKPEVIIENKKITKYKNYLIAREILDEQPGIDNHEKKVWLENILKVSISDGFVLKPRQGGERCRPKGRGGSVSIKKLLQENNIPPWQRDKVLLAYIGERIVAVVNNDQVIACE